MREIEFRGQRADTKEWVYGGFYKHQNRTPCPIEDSITDKDLDYLIIKSGFSDWNMPKPIECIKVISETVGQYIGIKDIHGKKVYKGDIVKVKQIVYTNCYREEIEEIREYIGEVVWHQFGWHIAEKIEDEIQKKIAGATRYHSLWLWNVGCEEGEEDDTMKVLGNRWDNPEMRVIEI